MARSSANKSCIILPLVAAVALFEIASLTSSAFVGKPQELAARDAVQMNGYGENVFKNAVYNSQGIFPGGGDGSWREGKKGSFNQKGGEAEPIRPVMWSSGTQTFERLQDYINENGARFKGDEFGVEARQGKSNPNLPFALAAVAIVGVLLNNLNQA